MKALWDMGKDLLEEKPRPYLSVIIYIICGLIELLCIVSVIAPFHVSINFLDNIKWARSINDNDLITRVTFWSTIVYLGVFLARKEIDRRIWRLFWGKKEILLLHVSAIIYTIDNLIELLAAGTSLFFIVTVFVEVYKSGTIFISRYALCIYAMISIQTLSFLWYRFYMKNLIIIDNNLRKSCNISNAK